MAIQLDGILNVSLFPKIISATAVRVGFLFVDWTDIISPPVASQIKNDRRVDVQNKKGNGRLIDNDDY